MDKIVKCIAIDYEPLALEVLEKFCNRIEGIELNTYTDPEAGIEAIRQQQPDIVFLDIEMDNINGLAIAAQLPPSTCFIFTTAYLNYVLDGFNLDAVDYLHKPFSFARFETAFNKAMRRVNYNRATLTGRTITVKQEYNNVNIPLDDILYIEAMEGYSKIFCQSRGCVISRIILKNLLAQLPEESFLRIHRSFVVSVSKVKSYTRQRLTLSNDINLPIGRLYATKVMATLAK